MSVAVQIENISKSYGKIVALSDINLDVGPGELFGFIGPDGSGKTTLFRLITTLLLPDQGKISIDQFDVRKDYKKVRKITGYMPGRFSLYMDLTVQENLNFYARIFGTSLGENYDLIKDIYSQIEPFKNRRAGKLSGGMKQKLALSCALIHKPQLLVLDEPTTGVDAVSRKEFWDLLKKMQQKGITILVSTPYMDEASLCDKVALMQNGKLLAIDEPINIVLQFRNKILAVKSDQMFQLLHDLDQLPGDHYTYRFGENIHVSLEKNSLETKNEIESFLLKKGHQQIEIKEKEPVIEDCFLDLMDKTSGNEKQ